MERIKISLFSEGAFFPLLLASLKGVSQVVLIENAITGLLILIAITIESYYLGIIALLSAIIGTFIGRFGGAEEQSINKGLMGYNSVLTGIALALFLSGPYMWIIALIGSALAAVFTATLMHFMTRTEIPILTFPFIILTWFIMLASYKLKGIRLSSELEPQNLTNLKLNIAGEIDPLHGIFNGMGQIFFVDNILSGIIIYIAVFLVGKKIGLMQSLGM